MIGAAYVDSASHSFLQAISRGITKAGVGVDMINLELESMEGVSKAISASDGFILGKLMEYNQFKP
jgi:flavorubredoxin